MHGEAPLIDCRLAPIPIGDASTLTRAHVSDRGSVRCIQGCERGNERIFPLPAVGVCLLHRVCKAQSRCYPVHRLADVSWCRGLVALFISAVATGIGPETDGVASRAVDVLRGYLS